MGPEAMDCAAIRDALIAGEKPGGERVEKHLRTCDACTDLLQGGPELARHLAEGVDRAGEAQLGALRAAVRARIEAERGPRARLRSWSAARRVALLTLLVVGLTALLWLVIPRPDLAAYPTGRMVLSLALMTTLVAAATWRLFRPVHLPPAPPWTGPALLAAGLTAPYLLAALPFAASTPHAHVEAAAGLAFAAQAARCMAFGAVLGVPVLLAALVARRAPTEGPAVVALAGVAAGLAGNLGLQVHCAIVAPAHLIAGHATLMLLFAAGTMLWVIRRDRRDPLRLG